MPKQFTIEIRSPIAKVMAHAHQSAVKNGVKLTGDESQGKFSGHGVEGHYTYSDGRMTIVIQRKPMIAPWTLVESQIREFFSTHAI